MSDAVDFVDAALQLESTDKRAIDDAARIGSGLQFYGASVGAVRGTIRDVGHRYPDLGHDQITAIASDLWRAPVFERRLAAIVLLQTHLRLLDNSDLTRLEGFLRDARTPALADPLVVDVIGPLMGRWMPADVPVPPSWSTAGRAIQTSGCAAPRCWHRCEL